MTYKKYIKKDGKIYGPYTYQSKRVGDKVISEYCGATTKLDYKKIALVILGFAVLLAVVFFFFSFKGKVTGNVIEDNQIISEKVNVLTEPETISYPKVYFTLILRQAETSLEEPQEKPQEENTETPVETDEEEIPSEEQPQNQTQEQPKETNETIEPIVEEQTPTETILEEEIPQEQEETIETPIEEEPQEEIPTEIPEEQPVEETPETSAEETTQENPAPITGGVISGFFKSVYNFFLGLGITGKTIDNPTIKEIQGEVSFDKPFVYELKEGESLELLSGSVKTDSKKLNDSSIKISLQGNKFIVETNYSEYVKSSQTNETLIIAETEFLTEEEKKILFDNFENASVQIIKSELFNGRYIIGYELGKYNIEYSYDSNLDEATLNSQMEKERIKWLKDIVHKLIEKENVPVEINQSVLTFPIQ